jgi:SAM-dependent methyltransferase
VLEVASGSGEHILHFADALPALTWQPSDPSPAARASIAAWLDEERHDNVLAPLALDAAAPQWPVARADAVLAINMVHISPWRATLGLLDGAARLLPPGGTLFLYGPYRRAGIPLSESNEAFDADLKVRNPDWGLRDLDAVAAAADAAGLTLAPVVEMPANNLSVMFARR